MDRKMCRNPLKSGQCFLQRISFYLHEVLEEYVHDSRGPSCLILGYSKGRPIHIVCGYTKTGWIRIITVYIPKAPKWIDEKTRAKGEKNGS